MSKVVTIHGHTLELAETEEELLDYLKDVSEFTRDEKGNN